MAQSFACAFGLPVVTLRPFNTYGPRQSERAVLPAAIRQALDPQCDAIRLGDLSPARDFTFVADTVEAFLRVAALDDSHLGTVFNAGTGRMVAIGEAVAAVRRLTGCDKPVEDDPARHRPGRSEVMALQADASRPQRRLRLGAGRGPGSGTDPDRRLVAGAAGPGPARVGLPRMTTLAVRRADTLVEAVREALVRVAPPPAPLHEPEFAGNEWAYVRECLDSGLGVHRRGLRRAVRGPARGPDGGRSRRGHGQRHGRPPRRLAGPGRRAGGRGGGPGPLLRRHRQRGRPLRRRPAFRRCGAGPPWAWTRGAWRRTWPPWRGAVP